jgi:hypothetical protein
MGKTHITFFYTHTSFTSQEMQSSFFEFNHSDETKKLKLLLHSLRIHHPSMNSITPTKQRNSNKMESPEKKQGTDQCSMQIDLFKCGFCRPSSPALSAWHLHFPDLICRNYSASCPHFSHHSPTFRFAPAFSTWWNPTRPQPEREECENLILIVWTSNNDTIH